MNETILTIFLLAVGFVVVLTLLKTGIRLWHKLTRVVTVWEHQAALHFKHGRFVKTLDSGGKFRFWGDGHEVILLDTRVAELVVQGQELITDDGATLKLTAVAQWKIAEPLKFHAGSKDAHQALHTLIQLALRQAVGGLALDAILEGKAGFGERITQLVRETASAHLGIEVLRVEIRDVMLGGELKSAYAGVISARKEAQAQQEKARGDAAALRTMANAARAFESNPGLLRLRTLEMLKEAGYHNQLIVGVPEELIGLVNKG